MSLLSMLLQDARTVAISGHVRPDGDCVGSCLAVWNYIRKIRPEIEAEVYLEDFSESFRFLSGADSVRHEASDSVYDLFISLDASTPDRLGAFLPIFERAAHKVVIDHHISNPGFGQENFISPDSSSTSELIYTMMDEGKIDREIAECIYLGIVHDTGVFKHSNTTEKSMLIAGKCLSRGASSSYIIDETFYKKTFAQNRALGLALEKAFLTLDGKMIVSWIDLEERRELGLSAKDLDGIIDQLRVTEGTVAAVFLYMLDHGEYKVSMRSTDPIDVAQIAVRHGGGGHARAAGFDLPGEWSRIAEMIAGEIKEQL